MTTTSPVCSMEAIGPCIPSSRTRRASAVKSEVHEVRFVNQISVDPTGINTGSAHRFEPAKHCRRPSEAAMREEPFATVLALDDLLVVTSKARGGLTQADMPIATP